MDREDRRHELTLITDVDEEALGDASWHTIGRADEIRDGDLRGAMVSGERLCVGRAGDRYFAIEDTCPHAGGSLSEGMIESEFVICPLHAYAFEVKSGRCPDDPGCSVRAFAVSIEDGMLRVDLSGDAKGRAEA